jgi:hypothetical protein
MTDDLVPHLSLPLKPDDTRVVIRQFVPNRPWYVVFGYGQDHVRRIVS